MNALDNPTLPAENPNQTPQLLLYAAVGNLLLLSLCLLYFLMRHLQPVLQAEELNPFTQPMQPVQLFLLFNFTLSAAILTFLPPLFQWKDITRWLRRPTANLLPDQNGEIGGEIFCGLLATLAWAGLALYLFTAGPVVSPFQILSGALALSMAVLFPLYALYPSHKAFRHRLRLANPWQAAPPPPRNSQLPLEFPKP